MLAPHRVLELADRLGFDLPHPFAGNLEDPADFFQGVRIAISQAVSETDDLPLSVGKGLEEPFDSLSEHLVRGRFIGPVDAVVLDELPKAAILTLPDRAIEAHRMSPDVQHPPSLVNA